MAFNLKISGNEIGIEREERYSELFDERVNYLFYVLLLKVNFDEVYRGKLENPIPSL
ncbi:hypothetical protein PU02_0633 [Bartonella ancashensis]|uniref:Uncharacterized protein n=1 Tax=Bartonella ancashensis TaxID=1318743 RepID=A0A0M4LSL8_9HYPH|nr:hypothetical protein PU02_0633 [Bartonella ancashensis]